MPKAKPKQDPSQELTKEEKEALRRPIGVYLRLDVRRAVEEIAEKEGLNRHAVLAYGISYFVRQYRAGKVKIEKQQKTTPNLDI